MNAPVPPKNNGKDASAGTDTQSAPPNLFFRLVLIFGSIFCVTVMSMIASLFGNPQAPPNKFFHNYGGWMIAIETALVLAIGFIALMIDRRRGMIEYREALEKHQRQFANTDNLATDPTSTEDSHHG